MMLKDAFKQVIMGEIDKLNMPAEWLNPEATGAQNTDAWFRRIAEWADGKSERVVGNTPFWRLLHIAAMALMALFQMVRLSINPEEGSLDLQISDAVERYDNENSQSR